MAEPKQTAHTPTPWQVCPEHEFILAIDGGMIAEMRGWGGLSQAEQWANAEFIVRCVNSHDKLVEALAWAMSYVPKPAARIKGKAGNEAYCDAYEQAEDALRAAGMD